VGPTICRAHISVTKSQEWLSQRIPQGGASGTGPLVRQLHEAGELRRLLDGGAGPFSAAPMVESDSCPASPARDPARSPWRTKDAPPASATATRTAWYAPSS
jgi:hypothetical protein